MKSRVRRCANKDNFDERNFFMLPCCLGLFPRYKHPRVNRCGHAYQQTHKQDLVRSTHYKGFTLLHYKINFTQSNLSVHSTSLPLSLHTSAVYLLVPLRGFW